MKFYYQVFLLIIILSYRRLCDFIRSNYFFKLFSKQCYFHVCQTRSKSVIPWRKSFWSIAWNTIYTSFPSQLDILVDMFWSSHSIYHTNQSKTISGNHVSFTLFSKLCELNSSLLIIALCILGHSYTVSFGIQNSKLVSMNNSIIELEKYFFLL